MPLRLQNAKRKTSRSSLMRAPLPALVSAKTWFLPCAIGGTAAGIIVKSPSSSLIRTTKLGQLLFGPKGLDPYMENPATLWLVHWRLAAHPVTARTTWFWAFNNFPVQTFEREHLVHGIERLASVRGWPRVSTATIKNDVACFIRTYVAQQPSRRTGSDGMLESPLTELGLIKAIGEEQRVPLRSRPKKDARRRRFCIRSA